MNHGSYAIFSEQLLICKIMALINDEDAFFVYSQIIFEMDYPALNIIHLLIGAAYNTCILVKVITTDKSAYILFISNLYGYCSGWHCKYHHNVMSSCNQLSCPHKK